MCARAHGAEQRVMAAAIARVRVSVAHDQHPQHSGVAGICGRMRSSVAIDVRSVAVEPEGQQRAHERLLFVCQAVQKRLALWQLLKHERIKACKLVATSVTADINPSHLSGCVICIAATLQTSTPKVFGCQ